jgi:CBS-domain-containing membrane protein
VLFASFVGVCPWSLALATGTAVSVMMLTSTLHPPAGANPILVMLSRPGWDFVFDPVLVGAVLIVAVAKVYRKLSRSTPAINKPE